MESSVPANSWLVIVNPNAGRRKGEREWGIISGMLAKYGISFKHHFTEGKYHAMELSKKGIGEGYRNIIAVGGDGTMNEVINGVFLQEECPTAEITLAMITVGTGNDWGRMFGIPVDYEEAIKLIVAGKVYLQDAGVVYYYHGLERSKRYFVNIAGLGFDALVARRTNIQKDKGKSSKIIYMLTLLRSLISYGHYKTDIEIDGIRVKNDTFTISLGIGRYSGGGMIQTPNAEADDGLFDITLIKNMRKGEIIRSLKMLYDGSILTHPKVESYKGKDIKIDSDPLIHVETDGESLGHSPIEFQIIPRSINIICGEVITG